MRAAERRQEVVKRVRVRDIDRGKLQTHFVLVALENIVIANREVEHMSRCDPWGILIVILRARAGIFTNVEVNCEPGHDEGKGDVGVARCPLQISPAWNCWSAVSPLRSTMNPGSFGFAELAKGTEPATSPLS